VSSKVKGGAQKTFHTLPEPGKGTILALRTWNILLLLAVLGRNYEKRATPSFATNSNKIKALF